MATPTEISELAESASELLAAIDRRWIGESDRKRANSISPRQEEAMERLRAALEAFTA